MANDPQPEQKPAKAPGSSSVLLNSTVLGAVVAAAIAGLANAYVAWINNTSLGEMETQKENEERYIEEKKAGWQRLLEISKLDPETAEKKLRLFVDLGIVTDPQVRVALERRVGSTLAHEDAVKNAHETVQLSSGWVGGGHNQDEMCNVVKGTLSSQDKYKNKTIVRLGSSEESQRDLLGHVTYRYLCTFDIS